MNLIAASHGISLLKLTNEETKKKNIKLSSFIPTLLGNLMN